MSLDYPVQIERLLPEDDGGYVVTAPMLPGCMSDGETPEEALCNVRDAIAAWIEAAKQWSTPIPAPTLAAADKH
jgi:predicted RNase H-like HicB family nuclease